VLDKRVLADLEIDAARAQLAAQIERFVGVEAQLLHHDDGVGVLELLAEGADFLALGQTIGARRMNRFFFGSGSRHAFAPCKSKNVRR